MDCYYSAYFIFLHDGHFSMEKYNKSSKYTDFIEIQFNGTIILKDEMHESKVVVNKKPTKAAIQKTAKLNVSESLT